MLRLELLLAWVSFLRSWFLVQPIIMEHPIREKDANHLCWCQWGTLHLGCPIRGQVLEFIFKPETGLWSRVVGQVLLPYVGGGPLKYLAEEGRLGEARDLCWLKVVYSYVVCLCGSRKGECYDGKMPMLISMCVAFDSWAWVSGGCLSL